MQNESLSVGKNPIIPAGVTAIPSSECEVRDISKGESGSSGKIPSYSLGLDIGYSSVKAALLNDCKEIVFSDYILHKGKIKDRLRDILGKISEHFETREIALGAVTGSESKFLSGHGLVTHVNEVSALVEGGIAQENGVRSIIEIGGESAKYITGLKGTDKSGIKIAMNSNCSAGTGSFLEEQVSRLNLDIRDYSTCAARAKTIPRIAGRCSVFAKTDIIHHQQEGVPVGDILLGLAYALIRNYRASVIKKLPLERPVMLAGGVGNNLAIIGAIENVLGLQEGDLLVSGYCGNIPAIGAAAIAQKDGLRLDFQDLVDALEYEDDTAVVAEEGIQLPGLEPFGSGDAVDTHICRQIEGTGEKIECYLGIDVGSTSTNLVLVDRNYEILSYRYLKTLGDPVKAVKTGLKDLQDELGERVTVIGAGTTGSGRYMVGRLVGADIIKDEITAQAKAALTIDSSVDTVLEIGGQDSKFISLKNGMVTDFQMNKICAAGTGSFIEEQSKKFDIPIEKFGDIAINSRNPVNLGERCTVFIETSIAAHLARGTGIADIASGLCYSIVKNYLNRVVGQKKLGERIFLQGGIAYNQGVVNAFRALTGKEITVPPFFSVTGAYGTAILVKEEMGTARTRFKGFEIDESPHATGDMEERVCDGKTGSEFAEKVNEIIFEGYDGSVDENKKTIGIPRALFTYGMYPMFHAFFRELGYNIVMSDPTSEETIRLGQEYSLDETCYPVKLINGHVAELVEKKVDFIFFPDLFTVPHPGSHSRQDFGCPYMQLAFKMVNRAMELDKTGIRMLSPTIGFSLGEGFMKDSFMELGKQLGKSPEETGRALQIGMKAFHNFEKRVEAAGREAVNDLKPDEKAFVLISKTYGVADPVLNLGIPERLAEMGYKTLPFFFLPGCDISREHPNMYWPFGQHILEAAQIVRQHPNLYAIFLTHHGCGPDTVFSHFFREIMAGKPYLNIEVDEHSSGVGVITRLEAFVNSLIGIPTETADSMDTYPGRVSHLTTSIKTGLSGWPDNTTVYVPDMYPYSKIFCECLKKSGADVKTLPKTDPSSIDAGRKYTVTNEYFSMTALIGDVMRLAGICRDNEKTMAVLIPQSEGAEVDGQYNRLLRTILDEEGRKDIAIIAPYIEDLLDMPDESLETIFLTLLAGDIVRVAPHHVRDIFLEIITGLIEKDDLNIESLKTVAKDVFTDRKICRYEKTIFAIGEPMVLYNDALNNNTFRQLEKDYHRVVYAPLSESMWLFWRDFVIQSRKQDKDGLKQKLDHFERYICDISKCLGIFSPFEEYVSLLAKNADSTMGYYAGAFGRYRGAKMLGNSTGIDGIITVASMYENTGVVLNIMQKTFDNKDAKPVLALTFDGNRNENDETKIESFLYYL